jgi:hypothetical protein
MDPPIGADTHVRYFPAVGGRGVVVYATCE